MRRGKPQEENEIRKDGKIEWRKHGGGSFRMADGRIIKQNQVFWARRDEIPKAFCDNVKPLEDLLKKEGPKIVSSTEFELVEHVGSDTLFDVVNKASGKIMNQNPLSKEAATMLLEVLA